MSAELCDVQDLVHDSISHSYSLHIAAKSISELRCFLMTLDIDTPHLADAVAAIDRAEQDPLIGEQLAILAAGETQTEIVLPVVSFCDEEDELNGAVGF